MKKVIPIFILVSVITAYSINIAYAGFGGGARGGTFGTGGFSTSTVSTQVTYQTLSDLAQDLNSQIAQGKYDNIPPFSLTTTINFACTIGTYNTTDNPLRYVIYVTYQGSKYYYKNDSGGLIYAYADTDNPAVTKPILDKLEQIRSQLVTANNTLTSISTKITNYIVTNIDDIETYLSTLNTTATNIYSRLAYTNANGVTGSVASFLYNIQNSTENIYSRLSYTDGNGVTGSVASYLYNIQNRLAYTVNGVTHSASSLLYNLWGNSQNIYNELKNGIYVTLYTTDSSGTSYSTISYKPEIIDNIITYINTNMSNKPLNILYRDGQDGEVASIVRKVMYAEVTTTGYVRLRVMWGSGSVGYAYLSTPNHVLIKQANTYVDDTTFLNTIVSAIENVSFNDDDIIDSIDRIYEWLDNADLATNETIVQVVQDYSNDVDNSVDWASKILDLFRDVFVFDRPAPSFTGILSYFYSLGRDAE